MRACFCPNCGASLKFEDDNRDFGFCQFCGAKIMLDDYRSTHRVVDEARIHEDETNRMIKMREMEAAVQERKQKHEEELQRLQNENVHRQKIAKLNFFTSIIISIFSLILIIIGVCLFQSTYENKPLSLFLIFDGIFVIIIYISIFCNTQTKNNSSVNFRALGYIQLTPEALAFKGKNYRNIQSIYTRLGFKRIVIVNMKDLTAIYYKSRGLVAAVTIDGSDVKKNQWYDPNAKVVIKYHGYDNR